MPLKIKRILAAWIDFMICMTGAIMIGRIISEPFSIFQDNVIFIAVTMIAYVVMFFGFLLSKDRLFGNASIGKKRFGLKIISTDDQTLSNKILFQRNHRTLWTWEAYPFMILYDNKSGGDIDYNTMVVDTTIRDKKEE